jgi:hypothetical protein
MQQQQQQQQQAPNPWGSQQQQQQQRVAAVAPPAAAAVWSIQCHIAAVTLALHYHAPTCAAAAVPQQQQQQQQLPDPQPPRFVVQCSGLVASLDLAGKGHHVTLKCYCLEAAEHLPAAWGLADRQLAGWSPRVLGAVPRAVPAVQGSSGFLHQVGPEL